MSSELIAYLNDALANLDHCASKSAASESGHAYMASTYGEIQARRWLSGKDVYGRPFLPGLEFFLWIERLMSSSAHKAGKNLREEISEIINDYI